MGLRQRESGTFYNLKIKDQSFPEFQLMGKKNGEWEVIESNGVYEGVFLNASIEQYEYQKKMRNKLVMEFIDPVTKEKETVSVNFNSIALSIINTLCSVDKIVGKTIMMNVYSKKDNNNEDRPRIYIEIDGEKGEWKFGADVIGQIYEHHQKWVDMFDKYIKPNLNKPDYEPTLPEDTPFEGFPDQEDGEEHSMSKKRVIGKKEVEPVTEEGDFDDLPF